MNKKIGTTVGPTLSQNQTRVFSDNTVYNKFMRLLCRLLQIICWKWRLGEKQLMAHVFQEVVGSPEDDTISYRYYARYTQLGQVTYVWDV